MEGGERVVGEQRRLLDELQSDTDFVSRLLFTRVRTIHANIQCRYGVRPCIRLRGHVCGIMLELEFIGVTHDAISVSIVDAALRNVVHKSPVNSYALL